MVLSTVVKGVMSATVPSCPAMRTLSPILKGRKTAMMTPAATAFSVSCSASAIGEAGGADDGEQRGGVEAEVLQRGDQADGEGAEADQGGQEVEQRLAAG